MTYIAPPIDITLTPKGFRPQFLNTLTDSILNYITHAL